MPVNGIELKQGQVWITRAGHVVELYVNNNEEFPWVGVNTYLKYKTEYRDDGAWHQNKTYETAKDLIKIIKDVPMKSTNKFNPQPGDKIICNNGEEFICCTEEQLKQSIGGITKTKAIIGWNADGFEWQDWNSDGTTHLGYDEWGIREVIHQSSEVTDDKKEEVKEDTRYTMQDIKEAWDASGWVISTSAWEVFQKNLTKVNSPEYQEYLRLKAIYE